MLDTNVALIAQSQSRLLSRQILDAISNGPDFLSVISYWEVVIKTKKGSLNVGSPSEWWSKSLTNFSAHSLALLPEHIANIYGLPSIHQDPFDRALIGQALAEGFTILTTDHDLSRYASEGLQIFY